MMHSGHRRCSEKTICANLSKIHPSATMEVHICESVRKQTEACIRAVWQDWPPMPPPKRKSVKMQSLFGKTTSICVESSKNFQDQIKLQIELLVGGGGGWAMFLCDITFRKCGRKTHSNWVQRYKFCISQHYSLKNFSEKISTKFSDWPKFRDINGS